MSFSFTDAGLGLFGVGLALILLQAAYALLAASDAPPAVRYGILLAFAGVLVMLASLVKERLDEERK